MSILNDMNEWSGGGRKKKYSETGLSSSSILNEMNTQIFDKHQQFLEEQKRKEEQARQQLASLSYQTPKTTVKPAQPEIFSQKHPILATIADHAARALFNGDGNFGPMKEIYEGMKNPKPENQNFLNKVGTSLRAGTGDTVKSLGNAANYLGFENAGKALKEVGEDVTKGFDTKYDKEFSASSLLDPDWYATSVSRSVPTTAGLLVAGLAGGELAGAAAGLTKLGSFGQTVVKGVSGALLGRSTESAMEAGETLEQALERGMSKEEAKKVANSTFAKNMALATTDAAQLIDLFSGGKISSKTLGKLTSNVGPKTNAAFKIGANAAIEGGEEVYQEWAQRSSLGDPFKMDSQTWEAFTIGALMGGTMGLTTAAKESYDGLKTKAVDNMPDDLRKEYDKVHEQSIKSGMDPIDARDKALDVLSQTPKGNEYVRKIFADSTRDIDQVFMKHAKSFTMNLDTETADMKRAELQSALQQAQAANDLVAVKGIEDSIVRFNVWRGLAESGVQQPPVSSQTQTMGLVTNENPTLNNEPVTKTIQPQQEFDLTGQTDINTEHIPPISETGFTFMDKPSKEKVYREIDMDNGEKLYVTVNDPENVRFMVTSPNKEGSYHTEIKLEDGRTVPINGGWSSGPRVVKYYTGLDLETKPDGSYRVKGYKNPNNLEAQPSAMQQQVKKEDTSLEGKTDSAFTPDNQEISFRYAIKDADSLITSNDINIKENPDYPQELQPRDRTREGMVQQINEIAGKLNPKLLGTSPNVSSGAPIIGPDNVVESGNGRTIALKKVYEGIPEKAAEYKRYLTENAKEFGLSAADIENMSKPVLVRVRETEVNRSDFAKKANAPETAALSATEQAIIDADKISQGLMNLFTPDNNGNINTAGNRSFITEFMNQTMSTPERTRYMTEDGVLNADGLRRVQNAVFARAYGDASAIEKLAEATETNVQNTIKGMLAAAPRMAYIKQGIEDGTFFPVDISSDLTAAMNKLSELRYEGRKVDAYLNQLSMLEEELTPEGKELLRFFDQARSIKAVKEMLLTYAHAVESVGNPNQLGLFGEQPPTKADMLTATFRRIEKNDKTLQATLFADERASSDGDRATDAQSRKQVRQENTGEEAQFRSALREYLTYREGTGVSKEELKKRELKRRESELARTKVDGFFPTPTPIVKDMMERANIQTGDKVLEPSAGKGNIADIVREQHPDNALDVVEYNNSLASFLEEKGHNVVGSDFLEHKGKYDKIIMNPPFEKGQDIDHVRHAYELLKPGGKIVAIMSEGPFYRSDKKAKSFREWMEEVGGISEEMDGAFKQAERQTGVKTRLVEIEKPAISKTEKQTKKEKQAVETFYETKSNTEMKTSKIKQDGVSRTPDDLLSDFVDFQPMADALKNQTSDEGKTVTRIQIINHIKDAFGVSVGTGKYRQRARAIHKVAPGVIRSKNFADFVALTHELGHRLDKVYDFSGYKTLEKDLYNLAGNLQLPKSANNALRRSEGVAEFMRLYVYDQGLAKQLAPTFFAHFQETMKANDMLPAVNDLISLLQDWVTQSSSARVRGTLRSLRREKQRITKEEWYTRLYDELHPLQKAVERMTNGAKLAPEKDPFKLAWVSRGVSGKIRAFLEHGVVDENGKKVGKSLAEIFNSVDNLNAFEEYVTSLRALELHKQGKLKTPINIPDAMRVIEDGKNKYHQAATDLYAYKDAVLDELVKSGMMTEEDITTMREQNPFHVPFYRVFDDVNKSGGRGNGKNFANLQQAIKKMKDTGSSRDIINPLESVVKDTFLFLSLAERNNVARSLADLTKYDDSGQWLEKIEMPNTPVRFSLEDVEKQLEKAGVDLNEADLGAMLMVFRANNRPNSKEQVITVWRDGKQELYQVKDPDLYQALLALDPEPFNWIVKYLSIPNNTLRTGITLSPAFTIKSALRALPAMMIQTKSYQGMEFIKDLPQNLWRGLFASLKKDELYTEWISSGAAQSTLLSIERNYLQEQQQRLLETRTMKEQLRADAKYGFMPTAFRGMRAFAEAFDEMVRIAEYTQAKKKTGSRLEAALRSRDVDIDFSRFGAKGVRQFNRISLFFNVALQGPEKIYRTFKENPKQTMMRGFMFLTLPTLALLAMNWDNEDYWELPQYERDMFWLFPTGNGKFFRIPIPFEWGILFKTMPERAFIWMKQKDPEVKEFLDRIWEYTVPSVMPTFIMPFIEWMTEKRLGLWYDIIPAREKSLPPEMQYGPGTSEVSKGIGKLFEVSPRKIDNLIRGTTGQLGDIALQTIDDITEIVGIRPESSADKKGVWGKTFTTSPFEKSSYHTEKFYKKLNKLEIEHKREGVKGEPNEELQTFRKASKLMSDMRRLREETLKSKDYTAEQKADAVKKLNTAATDLARVAMGKDPLEEENLRVVINALR